MTSQLTFSIQVPVTCNGMSDCHALYLATLTSKVVRGRQMWTCDATGEHAFTATAPTLGKVLGALLGAMVDHYGTIPAVLPEKLAQTVEDARDAAMEVHNARAFLAQAERDLYYHRAQRNVDRVRFRARVQELRAEIASLKAKLEAHRG